MLLALLIVLLSPASAAGDWQIYCRQSAQLVEKICKAGVSVECSEKFYSATGGCQRSMDEAYEDFQAAKDLKGKEDAQRRLNGSLDDSLRAREAFAKVNSSIDSFMSTAFPLADKSIGLARARLAAMKNDVQSSRDAQSNQGKEQDKLDQKGKTASTNPDGTSPPDKKQQALKTPPQWYQDAGKALEDLSRSAGKDAPEVLKNSGESYLDAKSPKDAERVLRLSTDQKPDDAQSQAYLAVALAGQGRSDEALERARKALSIDANEPHALELMDHLRAAIPKTGSKFDLSQVGFGGADKPAGERSVNNNGPSVAEAGKIAAGNPPSASSPSEKIMLQASRKLRLRDLEGALVDATRAIAAAPGDARALALRAGVSNRLKNHQAALSDALAALALDPDSVEALLEKSYALQQLGDYEGALAAADSAVRLAPGNALARLYRGQAAEKLGRIPEALEDFRAAARLDASLEPLYASAQKRLSGAGAAGAGASSGSGELKRWGVRSAVVGVSVALILLGLTAARELTRRRAIAAAAEAPAPSQGTVPPGTVLGSNYRVVREVGRGGMGVVYEAFDQALERKVAVKQLRSELCGRPGERELFLREARLVAKLRHPNIVEIHAVIDEGELYLVFDYVEGKTLAEMLAARGMLPLAEASRILKASAEAVGWAHGKEIVHRDLKPSNIMVADDGSVKVMDFGIARQSRDLSSPTLTSIAGTPRYMAPEQDFGAATRESDLYSLGMVAYEMTVGGFPFPGPDIRGAKLKGEFAPASAKVPSLPPALDGFFSKALNPRPEQRFRDAGSFLAAFLKSAA